MRQFLPTHKGQANRCFRRPLDASIIVGGVFLPPNTMNVVFIGDKHGKVHYNRYCEFVRHIPECRFRFALLNDRRLKKICGWSDVVYLASYAMLLKFKDRKLPLVGSATSWKLILESNSILNKLSAFRRLSANNKALSKQLTHYYPSIVYIPNGVDTVLFSKSARNYDPQNIVFGWTGNTDRRVKNFHIVSALREQGINIKTVETTKAQSNLRHPESMRSFYHSIDYYLVCSSYEGTPNPALEAASCGVPLVTTAVGNMPELITEGQNGFIVECNLSSILRCITKLESVTIREYNHMRNESRKIIERDWTWKKTCRHFHQLFKSVYE